jgi:hypothetical protein
MWHMLVFVWVVLKRLVIAIGESMSRVYEKAVFCIMKE